MPGGACCAAQICCPPGSPGTDHEGAFAEMVIGWSPLVTPQAGAEIARAFYRHFSAGPKGLPEAVLATHANPAALGFEVLRLYKPWLDELAAQGPKTGQAPGL